MRNEKEKIPEFISYTAIKNYFVFCMSNVHLSLSFSNNSANCIFAHDLKCELNFHNEYQQLSTVYDTYS